MSGPCRLLFERWHDEATMCYPAAFTLLLAEGLRLAFGNRFPALDSTIYGLMLVLFIIYMPKGILGTAIALFRFSAADRPSSIRRP